MGFLRTPTTISWNFTDSSTATKTFTTGKNGMLSRLSQTINRSLTEKHRKIHRTVNRIGNFTSLQEKTFTSRQLSHGFMRNM
jgi:hypothetical protein